jgi:hypothetical protein
MSPILRILKFTNQDSGQIEHVQIIVEKQVIICHPYIHDSKYSKLTV